VKEEEEEGVPVKDVIDLVDRLKSVRRK